MKYVLKISSDKPSNSLFLSRRHGPGSLSWGLENAEKFDEIMHLITAFENAVLENGPIGGRPRIIRVSENETVEYEPIGEVR